MDLQDINYMTFHFNKNIPPRTLKNAFSFGFIANDFFKYTFLVFKLQTTILKHKTHFKKKYMYTHNFQIFRTGILSFFCKTVYLLYNNEQDVKFVSCIILNKVSISIPKKMCFNIKEYYFLTFYKKKKNKYFSFTT